MLSGKILQSCGQPEKMAKNGNWLPAIVFAEDDPRTRRRFDQL